MGRGTGTGSVEAPKVPFPTCEQVQTAIPIGRMAYIAALKGYTESTSIQINAFSGLHCARKRSVLKNALDIVAEADRLDTMEPPLTETLSQVVQAAAAYKDPFRNQNYFGSSAPEYIKSSFECVELILAAVIDHGMRGTNG